MIPKQSLYTYVKVQSLSGLPLPHIYSNISSTSHLFHITFRPVISSRKSRLGNTSELHFVKSRRADWTPALNPGKDVFPERTSISVEVCDAQIVKFDSLNKGKYDNGTIGLFAEFVLKLDKIVDCSFRGIQNCDRGKACNERSKNCLWEIDGIFKMKLLDFRKF